MTSRPSADRIGTEDKDEVKDEDETGILAAAAAFDDGFSSRMLQFWKSVSVKDFRVEIFCFASLSFLQAGVEFEGARERIVGVDLF